MKRILMTLLLVALLSACACAEDMQSEGKTMGTDIAFAEITDFYYTLDAGTDPPHYQRYRFFPDEGQYFFYHETRNGGGWPQTEENITASGTVKLTNAQWTSFCELVEDGSAKTRTEALDDGDSGPWLYLYWKGGEPEGREFTFASYEKRLAFEAFCAELAGQRDDKVKDGTIHVDAVGK